MALYVQSFTEADQAKLDSCAFQAVLGDDCHYSNVATLPVNSFLGPGVATQSSVNHAIQRVWLPILNGDLPRIRGKDILAFRDIWIRNRFTNCDFAKHLRGFFIPRIWTPVEHRYTATLFSYRTFKLCVFVETSDAQVT